VVDEPGEQPTTGLLADDLLEILACPACKSPVALEGDRLVCHACRRKYRIEDGIPIMLIDEAEQF
jgi:uncharacterized protein